MRKIKQGSVKETQIIIELCTINLKINQNLKEISVSEGLVQIRNTRTQKRDGR